MKDFHEIYVRYANDVYRYLLALTKDKELAEDFTQETFLRAIKNINTFKGKCSIYSWLCSIGKNIYYDYLRKDKKDNLDFNIDVQNAIIDFKTPEFILNENEANTLLYTEIENLDEPGKSVLKLHLLHGISLKNISALYKKGESWGRVTFYRAKIKLKERIMNNAK
ncbi:MAG: RNA polymerase sigma factor [Sarcina sp.]